VAASHGQKTGALAKGFFPNPPADLDDVQDQTFSDDWEPRFDIQQEVTPAEVAEALAKTSPWKAPGVGDVGKGEEDILG
jgi:hypothetical protein